LAKPKQRGGVTRINQNQSIHQYVVTDGLDKEGNHDISGQTADFHLETVGRSNRYAGRGMDSKPGRTTIIDLNHDALTIFP
jgi:hypothetical protein